jgi:hypothetical protein
MGLGSVSYDLLIPSGVRLMVVLLVIVRPVVSDMPIYDGFLDVYVFCMLHVLNIYIELILVIVRYFKAPLKLPILYPIGGRGWPPVPARQIYSTNKTINLHYGRPTLDLPLGRLEVDRPQRIEWGLWQGVKIPYKNQGAMDPP